MVVLPIDRLIDLGELTLEIECVKSDLSIERTDVVTGGERTDDFAERFLYLVSLISVPAIVFFPAYSMYFFAGRYPRLAAALYPAPPITRASAGP